MAWSDAARKAAAEARRHHAKTPNSLDAWNSRMQVREASIQKGIAKGRKMEAVASGGYYASRNVQAKALHVARRAARSHQYESAYVRNATVRKSARSHLVKKIDRKG